MACTKKRFTKAGALVALAQAQRAQLQPKHTARSECRYYWCKECEAYHLTSSPKRKKKEINLCLLNYTYLISVKIDTSLR